MFGDNVTPPFWINLGTERKGLSMIWAAWADRSVGWINREVYNQVLPRHGGQFAEEGPLKKMKKS